MVIYEELTDGTIHAYSDNKLMIHGGNPEGDYAEAYDPKELHREYTETDIPISEEEEKEKESEDGPSIGDNGPMPGGMVPPRNCVPSKE